MNRKAPLVAGVDGCPAGWVAAIGSTETADPWIVVAECLEQLIDRHPRVSRWAVDMPIGLAEDGQRECDRLARERLGPNRRSSVFSAPPRLLVQAGALDYHDACTLAEKLSGKKVSRQAWNLLPKIGEVRRLVIERPRWRQRLFETHPELAFAHLAGGAAIAESKKSREGCAIRIAMLADHLGSDTVQRALLQTESTRGVAKDDTLDALVCWTVAKRVTQAAAESLPCQPSLDEDGLVEAILY
ncbi:hypothetical protein MalM25_13570 [Planctomycetes bacterium MalM25]|nr:hypothetical protein MalM25_13570 [Planctomycetes bacterium MalM25]